jgi:hypothetical protein
MNTRRKKGKRRMKQSTKAEHPAVTQKNDEAAKALATPRPRVKMPDALRAAGIDETRIAECFAKQIQKFEGGNEEDTAPKLLLDYLKECIRVLYPPARRWENAEKPPLFELVHFVPRPDRSDSKPSVPGA